MVDEIPAGNLQTVDDKVRKSAQTLISETRSAALATLDPATGDPAASRVLLSTDPDGQPVFLISRLSLHFAALEADPRASLLVGEPGSGDPLTGARLSLAGKAERLRDEKDHALARGRCLARHPKSKLYINLPDFAFWRLNIEKAGFIEGFGKAYALSRYDLIRISDVADQIAAAERGAVDHMNDDHLDAIELYATVLMNEVSDQWHLSGIDAHGMELRLGNRLRRFWFEPPLEDGKAMHMRMVHLAKTARKQKEEAG